MGNSLYIFCGTICVLFGGLQNSNFISQISSLRSIISYSLDGSIENISAGLIKNTESVFTQLIKLSFSDEALAIALPGVC